MLLTAPVSLSSTSKSNVYLCVNGDSPDVSFFAHGLFVQVEYDQSYQPFPSRRRIERQGC